MRTSPGFHSAKVEQTRAAPVALAYVGQRLPENVSDHWQGDQCSVPITA
jgi:hypothetical protein